MVCLRAGEVVVFEYNRGTIESERVKQSGGLVTVIVRDALRPVRERRRRVAPGYSADIRTSINTLSGFSTPVFALLLLVPC
jgi:hypothetical protein